ncbi:hypothetical protein [Martelella alba]|uniref:Adenine nucleotide alpha hydrolase n=1 Tax=Martelella alba TaxID=2590451 RepID=A0ABY2SFK3_9HYPH|nr:hypothetical protein [Martelella alba]TKI03055.1 hypothetical protein FCN80_22975 [Martelella alba]
MKENDLVQRLSEDIFSWFTHIQNCIIATSGGIDSMLLSYIANQAIGQSALIAHSSSPAVPSADRDRVNTYAVKYGWNLTILNTGEIEEENYIKNPINRCYFCKKCLFSSLKTLGTGPIVTGSNIDDLGDYRPGLIAASEFAVRQPYIELGIDKTRIRLIAAYLNLTDLQNIPSSPCLASRIETGITINSDDLKLIDDIEDWVRGFVNTSNVRLRLYINDVVLQLDKAFLDTLTVVMRRALISGIEKLLSHSLHHCKKINIAPYSRGSAFVGEKISVDYRYERKS